MLRSILMTGALALTATAAHAASVDYFLKIDGIDGEARVEGWSFGACNSGCMTSSTKREVAAPNRQPGSIQASQNGQSLRESPPAQSSGMGKGKASMSDLSVTRAGSASTGGGSGKVSVSDLSMMKATSRAAGGVQVAAGDIDGDGRADLAYAGTLDAVEALTLRMDKASPVLLKVCGGKHIDKAVLRVGADEFEISGAASCQSGEEAHRSGLLISSGMPNRISMNMTTPRQTQGATFGERCQAGVCAAGSAISQDVYINVSGGQMKHTKTGHVTILK